MQERDGEGRKRERERKRALNGTSEKKKDEKPSAQNIETLYASLLGKREREREHSVVSLGARSFEDFPPAFRLALTGRFRPSINRSC